MSSGLPSPFQPGPQPVAEQPFQLSPGLPPLWSDFAKTLADKDGALAVLLWPTRAAWEGEPVAEMMILLRQSLPHLDEETGWRIETALSEAVGNALTHGNMALDSAARAAGDFEAWDMAVEAALNNRTIAARPLLLAAHWQHPDLVLTIANAGEGFDPDSCSGSASETDGAGRGIGLIRSLCDLNRYDDRGRRLTLTFRLQPEAQ